MTALPVLFISQVRGAGRLLRDSSDFIQRQSVHKTTVIEVALAYNQVRHSDVDVQSVGDDDEDADVYDQACTCCMLQNASMPTEAILRLNVY